MRLSVLPFFALLAANHSLIASALPTKDKSQKDISISFEIGINIETSSEHSPSEGFRAVIAPSDVQWMTQVSIGSQNFSLLIDTGSADLWVFGKELPASQRGKHRLYDSAANGNASVIAGQKFHVDYSIPGASGYVVAETVNVGGATVNQMPVGIATNVSKFLIEEPQDGILGLAFKHGNSIRPDQRPTFMEILQKKLSMPVFTCNFKSKSTGILEFGAIDSAQYKGSLTTVPVNNRTDGSWTVDNLTFSVGNVTASQSMLFDTGAVWMTVDPKVAVAYWAQVPGAKDNSGNGTNYVHPCNTVLPDLNFATGENKTAIPGSFFHGALYNGNGGLCTSGLQGGVDRRGSVGSPFFASQFVVFNQAEPSISFAPHA